MKNFKYLILGLVVVLSSVSCKKWLDVNTDPNNPNNTSVLIENRLPWIEHFYMYSSGVANYRTSLQAGVLYSTNASGNTLSTTWQCSSGNSTTPYQTWFVAVSSNVVDMYNSAEKIGAYHYMAAANVYHALGFMQMLDIYGEMPYTEAATGNPSPKPDDGKTIYYGCMDKLNEAIGLFGQAQQQGAPALAAGDYVNNGDVDKWIKLCWGLKARYMLKLSKKVDLYNADSILYCISKGPQSNADNSVVPGFNNSTETDYLLGDPVVTNGLFNYAAYGSTQRISKYYYDMLTNLRGSGYVDPRMTKIVPGYMGNVKLNANGELSSYTWRRSIGVDSYGAATRLIKGGGPATIQTSTYADTDKDVAYTISDATERANFVAALIAAGRTHTLAGDKVTVTYPAGSIYIGSTNYVLAGDTVYTNLRASALATSGNKDQPETDVCWYPSLAAYAAGVVGSTGSFQTRPVSDQDIVTYPEMCFIKAEVYMRKGDAGNAYTAYRQGIQAHMDKMQAKLTDWQASGYAATNPDMAPMNQSAINAYMASAAVCQSSGALTMSDIMLQKYIAMGVSIENFNDMRRFNFSVGDVGGFGVVYPGYQRGAMFTGSAQLTGTSPNDPRYWMRRWMLPPTYEINYNSINTLALNKHAADVDIWCMPVWWDCATDDEYYGYLNN